MPKIKWDAADQDQVLTADDIDSAEEGFEAYAGNIPPGGVYRFKWGRAKYTEFGTGNQGFNIRLSLDGSWKTDHKEYDGCPLWDRVVMTKAAAGFVKAFAAALGVASSDLISKVVVDEDGYVTKIGSKTIDEDIRLYVLVKRGSYNDEPRLEKSGTGYQIVEQSGDPWAEDKKVSGGKKDKKASGSKKKSGKPTDDEPPF